MSDPNDKRLLRKNGEFTKERKIRQRQSKIYNLLNEACKKVMDKDSDGLFKCSDPVEVIVDNRKFTLTNGTNNSKYHFLAFIRMTNRGIVLAEYCDKDGGWIDIILPYPAYISPARSVIKDMVAAYVSKIEILQDTKPNSQTTQRLKYFLS